MTAERPVERWGIEWYSRNRIEGVTRCFMWNGTLPFLFDTREEARDHIALKWGYIKTRRDLRTEPHGWRLPRAVKVRVRLEKV